MEQEDSNFDWNDVRLFVLVAQCRSLRQASHKAGRSINSIRRRLEHLEQHAGCALLVRSSHGSHLTEDGKRLLSASRGMFDASFAVAGALTRQQQDRSGKVAVGTLEGLGVFWLARQLEGFRDSHSSIQVNLQCAMVPPDVYSMQTDLSVQMHVPDQNELMVTKLGYMHLQLFASQDAVLLHGNPKTMGDLDRFGFVEQTAPHEPGDEGAALLAGIPKRLVTVRTNSCAVHAQAIDQSMGVGLLPTYAKTLGRPIVPVLKDTHFRREIYLAYRRDIGKRQHVRATIDWLKSVFDPKLHPWFAAQFISSEEFDGQLESAFRQPI